MIALLAFTRSPLGRVAVVLLGVIVLIGVLWSCVAKRDREMIERANDKANVAAAKAERIATKAADTQRAEDQSRAAAETSELDKVIRDESRSVDDRRRDYYHRVRCQQARAAGAPQAAGC